MMRLGDGFQTAHGDRLLSVYIQGIFSVFNISYNRLVVNEFVHISAFRTNSPLEICAEQQNPPHRGGFIVLFQLLHKLFHLFQRGGDVPHGISVRDSGKSLAAGTERSAGHDGYVVFVE